MSPSAPETPPSLTPAPNTGSDKTICIAEVMTAHGVRGLVKLRCHLEDPQDLKNYSPLFDAKGKTYDVVLKNPIKHDWIAEIKGITDRNVAEKLRGLKLYIPRDALPETEDDEFYYEDLIGCKTISVDGVENGTVIGVDNFGAGDLLEIKPLSGSSYYLPIVEPYVQTIDIDARTIVIEPAEEFMNL